MSDIIKNIINYLEKTFSGKLGLMIYEKEQFLIIVYYDDSYAIERQVNDYLDTQDREHWKIIMTHNYNKNYY